MEDMSGRDRLWVALDYPTLGEAAETAGELACHVGAFKVGTELAAGQGWPKAIDEITLVGGTTFADMKLNDIPTTMVNTAKIALASEPAFINVHTLSGVEGMRAVKEASQGIAKVLGVTVLTSIEDEGVGKQNESLRMFRRRAGNQVLELASMAYDAGLDGLICSPKEISLIRKNSIFNSMILATPGIRPSWAQANDQKRFMTPKEAIERGGNIVIVGRPVTSSPLPGGKVEAAQSIVHELAEAA